jgi:predicted amidohydrolase YtcJ
VEVDISKFQFLVAITIGAAYDMGKENEMGSIEVGKRANFAVLDVNSLTTEPRLLKDIVVSTTVPLKL